MTIASSGDGEDFDADANRMPFIISAGIKLQQRQYVFLIL